MKLAALKSAPRKTSQRVWLILNALELELELERSPARPTTLPESRKIKKDPDSRKSTHTERVEISRVSRVRVYSS